MSTPITETEHVTAIPTHDSEYRTVAEASEQLCIGEYKLRKMCGVQIDAYQPLGPGTKWFIKQSTIDAWKNRHTHKAIDPTDRRYAA